MLLELETFCRNRTAAQHYLCGLVLIALIGATDFASGPEISFFIFYLIPIALISWYGERPAGYVLALVSAVTWFVVEKSTHPTYSQEWIPVWNATVRFTQDLLRRVRQEKTGPIGYMVYSGDNDTPSSPNRVQVEQ